MTCVGLLSGPFERAGVPRSVAMSIVGHKTESIYRRYAIVDETSWDSRVRPQAPIAGVGAFGDNSRRISAVWSPSVD